METINPNPGVNRPGGFYITDCALELADFRKGAHLLDIGCGSGATVDYLRKNNGFIAWGIDIDSTLFGENKYLLQAPGGNIPFPDASMDGILMECSFSLMEKQDQVLNECSRVLKPDGKLLISVMYAGGISIQFAGCLGRLETKENLFSRIQNNRFVIDHFLDFTHELKTFWGQMIFDKGAGAFYCGLNISPSALSQAKCSYCLIVATKKMNPS